MKHTPRTLLLFSGGLDSTALACLLRPGLLFVDYGQLAAKAERAATERIATLLDLELTTATLGIRDFGSGLLHGSSQVEWAPSPEWWPYRNQFLASAGAAIALQKGFGNVALGSVKTDGERHSDGTAEFYARLDSLISFQEGGVHVSAPAIGLTTEELLTDDTFNASLIPWTYSCHRSERPCGACPGCWKQQHVLANIGRAGNERL